MKTFLIFLAIVVLLGGAIVGGSRLALKTCKPSPVVEVSRQSVGQIVAVDYPWAESAWQSITKVTTERAVVALSFRQTVAVGVEAFIVKGQDGRRWLTWTGADYLYAIQ